jgi:hypothetical protein
MKNVKVKRDSTGQYAVMLIRDDDRQPATIAEVVELCKSFPQPNATAAKIIGGHGKWTIGQPSNNAENKGRPTLEHYYLRRAPNGRLSYACHVVQYTWGAPYAADRAKHRDWLAAAEWKIL